LPQAAGISTSGVEGGTASATGVAAAGPAVAGTGTFIAPSLPVGGPSAGAPGAPQLRGGNTTPTASLDFRGLPTTVRIPALGYLGVDATWTEPLQDAFLTSALMLCQQAPWAMDPALSHGLLSGARMAFLVLMKRIEAATGGAAASRARLQAAVPPGDFQLCEAALIAAGKSFEDVGSH
jgi:hypothetical protein